MTTKLCTFHDLNAIGIIRSFVSQSGAFFGATDKEMHQLEVMAEEASAFIIEALYPDKDKLFEIEAEVIDGGLCFYFHSKGIPVDEKNLPIYDTKNPESSIDGLPFFLLESLSDAMEFKNGGKDGWVLLFEKRFVNFKPLQKVNSISKEILNECAKERLKFSIATPSDAYDIVKLTYLTYRYSYAKGVFYYRKELENAIRDGRIIIFIAKNHADEVVVCSAYLRSSTSDMIAESGMLMSRPEYRKNSALLMITRKQTKFLGNNEYGLFISYATLVTSHTKSQRLVQHYGYFSTALYLSVHPKADFIDIDLQNDERESLLYALRVRCELDFVTVFVPKIHLEITTKLLEQFDNISLSTKELEPSEDVSKFRVDKNTIDSVATITFEVLAKDYLQQLKYQLKELESDTIITTFLKIPANKELPLDFEKSLSSLGLFYSGVVMKSKDEWELLYTRLIAQRFDFDSVKLDDILAIELKEYMYKRFKEVEV